jgi:hypothetical protein
MAIRHLVQDVSKFARHREHCGRDRHKEAPEEEAPEEELTIARQLDDGLLCPGLREEGAWRAVESSVSRPKPRHR